MLIFAKPLKTPYSECHPLKMCIFQLDLEFRSASHGLCSKNIPKSHVKPDAQTDSKWNTPDHRVTRDSGSSRVKLSSPGRNLHGRKKWSPGSMGVTLCAHLATRNRSPDTITADGCVKASTVTIYTAPRSPKMQGFHVQNKYRMS